MNIGTADYYHFPWHCHQYVFSKQGTITLFIINGKTVLSSLSSSWWRWSNKNNHNTELNAKQTLSLHHDYKTPYISETESWNRESKKSKINKLLSTLTPKEQRARASGPSSGVKVNFLKLELEATTCSPFIKHHHLWFNRSGKVMTLGLLTWEMCKKYVYPLGLRFLRQIRFVNKAQTSLEKI